MTKLFDFLVGLSYLLTQMNTISASLMISAILDATETISIKTSAACSISDVEVKTSKVKKEHTGKSAALKIWFFKWARASKMRPCVLHMGLLNWAEPVVTATAALCA